MNNTLATFDTVSLSQSLLNFEYDKKNYENFIKDKKAFRRIINHLDDDTIVKTYILKKCYKHSILGLEEFILYFTSYSYSNNSIDIKLKFNAKVLKLNYLDNINKNNYNYVANYLISELSNYVYMTDYIFYKLYVRSLDYTKNIKCDKYSQLDYVNTLSKVLTTSRSLKKVKTDFLDKSTLYLKLSNKSQIKMYNKNEDLKAIQLDKKNSNFIEFANELVGHYSNSNILRVEYTLNKHSQIKKYFENYQLDDNNNILFTSLLDNQSNIFYNKYNDIVNKNDILKLKMIDNTIQLSNLENSKVFTNNLLSQSLYANYSCDFDKLKKDIYSLKNANRQFKYRKYKEYEKLLKTYIASNTTENEYSINNIYNDFENKLKNIDEYCI